MVRVLDSGSEGPSTSPDRGNWARQLMNSHSASLHPGVQMDTGELSGKPEKMLGGYLR